MFHNKSLHMKPKTPEITARFRSGPGGWRAESGLSIIFMVKWSHFPLCYFLFIVCFLSEQMSCDLDFFFFYFSPLRLYLLRSRTKSEKRQFKWSHGIFINLIMLDCFSHCFCPNLVPSCLKTWRCGGQTQAPSLTLTLLRTTFSPKASAGCLVALDPQEMFSN